MAQPPPILIPAELDDADLTPAAFRVLCHLIRRGAAQNSGAWGSIENMAKLCRLADKTVKTALRELIATGWITRTSRPGFTSVYRLTTQGKQTPGVNGHPGSNLPQGVGCDLPHPLGCDLPHPLGCDLPHEGVKEGVKEGVPRRKIPPNPPRGTSPALENALEGDTDTDPQADPDTATDVPSALRLLEPLLLAYGRDPRQRLTSQEEHDLLPLLRTPGGLTAQDVAAVTAAVRQRRATSFPSLPDASPLRRVKLTFTSALADWPNQCAIGREIAPKKIENGPGGPVSPHTPEPSFDWEALADALWPGHSFHGQRFAQLPTSARHELRQAHLAQLTPATA